MLHNILEYIIIFVIDYYIMASTRFNSDEARQIKLLQEATDTGRYMLNTPGLGTQPSFVADPHIRAQGWGGNLMSNPVGIESSLFGITHTLSKCDNRLSFDIPFGGMLSKPSYPTNESVFTDESRAILPAWTARTVETNNWVPFDFRPTPIYMPFNQLNADTRQQQKDSHNNLAQPVCYL
jgi:hypothetical protein